MEPVPLSGRARNEAVIPIVPGQTPSPPPHTAYVQKHTDWLRISPARTTPERPPENGSRLRARRNRTVPIPVFSPPFVHPLRDRLVPGVRRGRPSLMHIRFRGCGLSQIRNPYSTSPQTCEPGQGSACLKTKQTALSVRNQHVPADHAVFRTFRRSVQRIWIPLPQKPSASPLPADPDIQVFRKTRTLKAEADAGHNNCPGIYRARS